MSKERRVHPRVDGEISANILINGEKNAVARVLDVSAGGVGFVFPEAIEMGDHIVAHLDGGARLEGNVVRIFDGGFAILLVMSDHKRKRLAETLDRERARGRAMDKLTVERRIATRVAGMSQSVICETADRRFPVRILDMSLTGVAIETDEKLEMEDYVVIGKMRGSVVRCDGNRYGIRLASTDDCLDAIEPTVSAEARRLA